VGTDVADEGRPIGGPRDEEVAAVPITTVLAVIPVADVDSACGWFESFFGRPADERPMDSLAEWHLSEPGIVQVFQSPDKAGQTAVNFIVDDLDDYLAGLASKGITATEPQEVSQGRQRLATITDPDGNQLSLIEQVLKGR
jgi:predicted enzyme related to lactoylglutathione lyase